MARKAGTKPAATVAPKSERTGPAPETHNSDPLTAKTGLTRAERSKARIRLLSEMRPIIAKLADIDALRKSTNKLLSEKRDAYKRLGFLLGNLDQSLKDEAMPRREGPLREQDRQELREDIGQATYIQPDLFDKMPQETRDEQYWGDLGYSMGIQGKEARAPEDMPERFLQVLLKKWHAAQETIIWSMAEETNPERTRTDIAPSAVTLEPEPTDDDFGPSADETELTEQRSDVVDV